MDRYGEVDQNFFPSLAHPESNCRADKHWAYDVNIKHGRTDCQIGLSTFLRNGVEVIILHAIRQIQYNDEIESQLTLFCEAFN